MPLLQSRQSSWAMQQSSIRRECIHFSNVLDIIGGDDDDEVAAPQHCKSSSTGLSPNKTAASNSAASGGLQQQQQQQQQQQPEVKVSVRDVLELMATLPGVSSTSGSEAANGVVMVGLPQWQLAMLSRQLEPTIVA